MKDRSRLGWEGVLFNRQNLYAVALFATLTFLMLAPFYLVGLTVKGVIALPAHVLVFALSAIFLSRVFRPRSAVAILLLVALAIVLELGQQWTGYRHATWTDVTANLLGVVVGKIIFQMIGRSENLVLENVTETADETVV